MSDKKQGGSNSADPSRGRPKVALNTLQPASLSGLPGVATVPPGSGPEIAGPLEADPVAAEPIAAGNEVVEQVVRDIVAVERTVAEALPAPTPVASAVQPQVYLPTFVNKEKIMTTTEEFVSFQHANFEAMIKSGQIWAAGVQDLSRQVAATMQAQIEETVGAVKAMTSAKSLREAVELQSSLTRNSVEKVVAEGSKLTDASMKLAEQAWAPITARLTTTAERFGRAA